MFDKLSNLPRLDKDQYIKTYVHTQKKFEQHYLSESAAENLDSATNEPSYSRRHSVQCGFETPKIQARAAGRRSPLAVISEKRTTEFPLEGVKEVKRSSQGKPKEKQHSKKNAATVDTSEEQEKRMQDRRERKRKKKEITRSPDRKAESSDENVKSKKKKDRRSTKCPAGLALMHGFTATNIGKDRITIKPPLHIGVFSKGKASSKTKTVNPTSRRNYFSESLFLDNSHKQSSSNSQKERRERRTKPRREPITKTDEDSSGTEGLESPAMQRRSVTPSHQDTRKNPKTPTSNSSSSRTSFSPEMTHSKPGSITWDIEKDITPSEVAAFTRESSRSIAVDTRPLLSKTKQISAPRDTASWISTRPGSQNSVAIPMDKNCTASDLSLGPSQSASQRHGTRVITRSPPPKVMTSKYFNSEQFEVQREPAPPRPPTEFPEHRPDAGNSISECQDSRFLPDDVPFDPTGMVDRSNTDHNEAIFSDYGYSLEFHQNLDFEGILSDVEAIPSHFAMQEYQECIEDHPSHYVPSPFSMQEYQECIEDRPNPYVHEPEIFDVSDYPYFNPDEDGVHSPQDVTSEDLDYLPGHNIYAVDSDSLDPEQNEGWDDADIYPCPLAGNAEPHHDNTLELKSNVSDQSLQMDEELESECMADAYPFSQGRALLVGISPEGPGRSSSGQQYLHQLPREEVDVAKSLTRHWYPQRW